MYGLVPFDRDGAAAEYVSVPATSVATRPRTPQVIAMRRMQAAGIHAFGGEVRVLKLAAPASPAPDEVVISVRAAGVGNWDEIVRVGNWDVGRRPPAAAGPRG